MDSHIIPAWVTRWIKETSATGYLRDVERPNVRRQDSRRHAMLCADCEQRFGVWENAFKNHVFLPWHDAGRLTFEYGEWFLLFALSIQWRIAVTSTKLPELPQYAESFAAADEAFSRVLLDPSLLRQHAYRHDLFFLPLGVTTNDREHAPVPPGYSTYCMRVVDFTPVFSTRRQRAALYAKLPGMLLWTYVEPRVTEGGWRRTRIGRHGTFRARRQELNDAFASRFLLDRVDMTDRAAASISERQQDKISGEVIGDLERLEGSKTLEALKDDWRIQAEEC